MEKTPNAEPAVVLVDAAALAPALLADRYAAVARDAADELATMIDAPASRRYQYDRQSKISLRYAMMWCRRIADRISERGDLVVVTTPTRKRAKGTDADAMRDLLRDIRPTVAAARDTVWKAQVLRRIDSFLKDTKAN